MTKVIAKKELDSICDQERITVEEQFKKEIKKCNHILLLEVQNSRVQL